MSVMSFDDLDLEPQASRPPTQNERVLAILRARRGGGLNTAELQEIPVVDGGPPILRLAARIHHLKTHCGCVISTRREPNNTVTYFLVAEVERQQRAA